MSPRIARFFTNQEEGSKGTGARAAGIDRRGSPPSALKELDDLDSLGQWEALFGERFRGLFVFGYNIVGDRASLPPERLFEYREALDGFLSIPWSDDKTSAHLVSPSWETVAMPTAEFRRLAQPLEDCLA